jgi:type II secretory pathway pseudopilin PulG
VKRQAGYTLTEIIVALIGIGVAILSGTAVYIALHFIAKFW